MIRFVYPNVNAKDEFIGCGRFLTTRADDPALEHGYHLAEPQIRGLSKILAAARMFAPDFDESDLEVHERKDHPTASYRGDSLGLAYLMALVRRARKTLWESDQQEGDVWFTGTIDMSGGEPFIGEVFPNQFAVKLEAFLTNQQDIFFIVPRANFRSTQRTHCRENGIRVLTFAQFATLPFQEHFTQKTILTLHSDEIRPFVECIFPYGEAAKFPSWEGQIPTFPSWEGQGVGKKGLAFHNVSEPTPNPSQEGNIGSPMDIGYNGFPKQPPLEWSGREALLREITAGWTDSTYHVLGLIGFGGEGKTSLVCKWIETFRNRFSSALRRPEAVFCWSFYTSSDVDLFFEAAFTFITEGDIEPGDYPSTTAKAHFLTGMVRSKPFLLVLDGVEVVQYQTGTKAGHFKNSDLRLFLRSLTAPSCQSFCLLTSRLRVQDLADCPAYLHCDVTRLNELEGQALLRNIGVKGTTTSLKKVVEDWDGHALTLCLLASYLVDRYRGKLQHLKKIPQPLAGEPRYKKVDRMLRLYDADLLNEAEKAFLMIFSAFRLPVKEDAFEAVFYRGNAAKFPSWEGQGVGKKSMGSLEAPQPTPNPSQEGNTLPSATLNRDIIKRLKSLHILHEGDNAYSLHPLIRDYYRKLLNDNTPEEVQRIHRRIKNYYLTNAQEIPEKATLEDVEPFIESVHHACRAGEYEDAFRIVEEKIDMKTRGQRYVLSDELGAWDSYLGVWNELYPEQDADGDPVGDPLVHNLKSKSDILFETGFCFMMLGRLAKVEDAYRRSIAIDLRQQNWDGVSKGHGNLVDLYVYQGKLDNARQEAEHSLTYILRVPEEKKQVIISLADVARVAFLRGELDKAEDFFTRAEHVERVLYQEEGRFLSGLQGLLHAEYLRRTGQHQYARQVAEANREFCQQHHKQDYLSGSHRVLGELEAETGHQKEARRYFDEAVNLAKDIVRRDTLIEALLSRGRWFARHQQDASAALRDMHEALEYAVNDGYRLWEADIRIALAWAHLAQNAAAPGGNRSAREQAKLELDRARHIGEETGYYWGLKDVEECVEKNADCPTPE